VDLFLNLHMKFIAGT